jgi:hypothetical protein
VEAWFADHPAVIPASGSSAQALTNQVNALTSVVTRMTQQGTEQVTQTGQSTLAATDETSLCSELRDLHMKAIVTMATALRGQVPGVGVIRMPPDGIRAEALVKAAEALATTAAVYQDVFVEHGLPQDFLEQLTAVAATLKSSVDGRGVALSKRTGATTSLAGDYKLGRRIVSMIDASLAHALKADPVTLAGWRQVKRATIKPAMPHAVTVASSAVTAGVPGPSGAVPLTLVAGPGAPAVAPGTHGPSTSTAAPETIAA